MISIARVLALAGVILIGLGAVIPTNKAQGLDSIDCSWQVQQEAFVDPDCLQEDAENGFVISSFGIILVAVAVLGLYPALSARPSRLWALALTAALTIAVLFIYQDALSERNLAGDLDWGWGVIGGGLVLTVLAAFAGTVRGNRSS